MVIVGSGAGGAAAAAMLAEAGLDVDRARGRRPLRPRQLPGRPARRDLRALPRRRPDDRRRAGRRSRSRSAKIVGGTTVINSGTCFRAPDAVLAELARPSTAIAWARRPRRRVRRGRGLPPRHPARPRADGPQRAAGDGGRGGARRQRRADPRNAGNCVQCSSCPFGCEIDAKRGDARLLPAARRGRRGADPGRGRGTAGHGRGRPRRRRRLLRSRRPGPRSPLPRARPAVP